MIGAIQNLVRATDAFVANAYLALFRERNALLSFLFHSLFRDDEEIEQNLVDPLGRTTVKDLREFIEYYQANDYRFVGPDDLLKGLDPSGRYALITFDDGYFNNSLALPVLEEYRVPAVVFVSTNHVLEQKNFWWDVLYRERTAEGATPQQITREAMSLKTLRTADLEARLIGRYGRDAFVPRSDIDRPFRPDELRELARHPLIHLGNHTADHAILSNYTPEQAHEQILGAQEALREITGVWPSVIAYPNGAHSRRILEKCEDVGLKFGFTVRPEKNRLPLGDSLLSLGRFAPLGNGRITRQCRTYRSDLQLYSTFRAGYLWLLGSQIPR